MTDDDALIWRRTALELVLKDRALFEKGEAEQAVRDADLFFKYLVNNEVPQE